MSGKAAELIWPLVHAERQALIADLGTLDRAQWEQESMLPGWSVHDVAAHLVDNALTTKPGFLRCLLAARFDFDRLNQRGIEAHRGASPGQTLQRLRAVARRTSGPPAAPASRLVEEIVHGEDIRRAAGLERQLPAPGAGAGHRLPGGDRQSIGGARELARRLQLVSADGNFVLGLGPQLRGARLDLLLRLTGRAVRPGALSGPGLALR